MNKGSTWLQRLRKRIRQDKDELSLASVTGRVDDSPGWTSLTNARHDYDLARIQAIYADALEAWRNNPIAWRIIAITTDFVVGDAIRVSSPNRSLMKFIQQFWNHPQNRMALRLPAICDELSRAGDLFILLFTNPQDGMSYLRFVTKDRIVKIETAENDWETELVYHERQDVGEARLWYAPQHPQAASASAVMLHYSINRPIGALLGEGDLTTLLPWLARYSTLLGDRVRLHWAIRSFLWFITVPTNAVTAKQEQYRVSPDAGSVVVKDESEKWEVLSPNLQAGDASHDLRAVRQMIDAGSGYPPHWRGESGDANLATATAMQGPTERHLRRRQQYFTFILQDLLYQAYQRSVLGGFSRPLPSAEYDKLINLILPEVSRWDNESLARSASAISTAIANAAQFAPSRSQAFAAWALRIISRFAGEPLTDEAMQAILADARADVGAGT